MKRLIREEPIYLQTVLGNRDVPSSAVLLAGFGWTELASRHPNQSVSLFCELLVCMVNISICSEVFMIWGCEGKSKHYVALVFGWGEVQSD